MSRLPRAMDSKGMPSAQKKIKREDRAKMSQGRSSCLLTEPHAGRENKLISAGLSSEELPLETVEPMHAALALSRWAAELEAQLARVKPVLQFLHRLRADVLHAV